MKIFSFNKVLKYFLIGVIIVAPIFILAQLFGFLLDFLQNAFTQFFSVHPLWMILTLISLIVILVTFVGFIFTYIIAGRLNRIFRNFLKTKPLAYHIYVSIEKMYNAISGKEQVFSDPVWVVFDQYVRKVGFITQEDMSEFGLKKHITVFIPTPFSISGDIVVVPKDNVIVIEKNKFQMLTLALTGGITAGDLENK